MPAVFAALAAAVVDAKADLDFRFNCLAALRRSSDQKKLAPILRPLETDPRFAPTVSRIRDAKPQKP